MIEIIHWLGLIFGLIGGLGMILFPAKAGNIRNPRLLGAAVLAIALVNVFFLYRLYANPV